MQTLNIVCPSCEKTNTVFNEVSRQHTPCSTCAHPLESTTPVDVNDEQAKIHISENDIPVIIDFYSPQCAPCMKMAPDFEEAAKSSAMEVRFLKVNTTQHQEVAKQYGVNQLPTVIAFKQGREVNRFSSALSKEQLKMWAESLIQMVL